MFEMLKGRLVVAAMALLVSTGTWADPVSYRFVGDIVGTLDGVPVSGLLTLTVTGDTNDLTSSPPAQFLNSVGTSTFELASVGSFTVTNSAYVFARADLGMVGFGVQGIPNCCDIIQLQNAVLAGYDLNDAIGPVSGPPNPSLADWVNVPTTAGMFTVTAMVGNSFQAIIGTPVPEPGLPALMALAGALAWATSRRRRAAQPWGARLAG